MRKTIITLFTAALATGAFAQTRIRLPIAYVPVRINAWYNTATGPGQTEFRQFDNMWIPNFLMPQSLPAYWGQYNYYYNDKHRGTDFNVSTGTSVYAAAAGTVVDVYSTCVVGDLSCNGGFGNYVKIQHSTAMVGGANLTIYAHLSRVDVSVGQSISCGQQIGLSGNTGHSSGSHLHFELRKSTDSAFRYDPFVNCVAPYTWSQRIWNDWTYLSDPLHYNYTMPYPVTVCQ